MRRILFLPALLLLTPAAAMAAIDGTGGGAINDVPEYSLSYTRVYQKADAVGKAEECQPADHAIRDDAAPEGKVRAETEEIRDCLTWEPPPPPPEPAAPEDVPAAEPVASSYAPSGDLGLIAACESGSDPTTNTGNGYYGAYQFDLPTWQAAGGTGLPSDASMEEQTAIAQSWIAAGNRSAWPNC